MKKIMTLALLGTAVLTAENMAVSFKINKVEKCDSPTSKMTVLNAHSENNSTSISMGMCQYENGKITLIAIVNEHKEMVLAPSLKAKKDFAINESQKLLDNSKIEVSAHQKDMLNK